MSLTSFNNDLSQAALVIFRFAASLTKPFIASIDGLRTKKPRIQPLGASLGSANPLQDCVTAFSLREEA
jgi:hypothetical protein